MARMPSDQQVTYFAASLLHGFGSGIRASHLELVTDVTALKLYAYWTAQPLVGVYGNPPDAAPLYRVLAIDSVDVHADLQQQGLWKRVEAALFDLCKDRIVLKINNVINPGFNRHFAKSEHWRAYTPDCFISSTRVPCIPSDLAVEKRYEFVFNRTPL